ncbi:ATP-binding protein [Epilithonimonas sp. JDS]|uniref:ATP-dependent nuclease n=1 Tax=Epilithonimonas sp. JDS TaxID=2902797 RepID=UPI001E296FB5|nr:AAA family ATPase [Epilithonimonas sp. JDS]MCD9855869.1 ATP-binding protein [Epilithonimonas sp. JDS]
MRLIERIEIRYFRSFGEKIVKITDLKDLNILSGSNDVGKSNVLKVLNLFFNNEINIGEPFDLRKDLSFLQRERSERDLENKKRTRTKDDPYASQRDLFVKVKIYFDRAIPSEKSTTPEKFWVEKTWDKNGFNKQSSNIQTAYIKKNKKEPTQNQAAALQGQLTQFLNSIHFDYVPAVKDRQFIQYLFKKLQTALFERDNTFQKTSQEINFKITGTTKDLFDEFREKTGIDAEFSIPESLIDFFTTINVSTEKGISLYSRGDGIQARFIPAILNEISKEKKNVIWGFEEPENSYEYRNAESLAKDFLNIYSLKKQIFITSHTKEFLSLIKGNEDRVSLHRVYKTAENGSLIDTYQKDKGFDKKAIQQTFWEGFDEKEKTAEQKDILSKIFQDIGFLETDQYLIEDLQNQLRTQRKIVEESGLKIDDRIKVINHLNKRLQDAILSKDSLEKEIEEFRKPILYVEDTYDQIYKIAFLKINGLVFDKTNFEEIFKNAAPFTIRRSEGAGRLTGRMRVANNDGYEDKKIIGLYDFDREGREQIHLLKKESFWDENYYGNKKEGFYRKRNDHNCFFAMLLPIPEELENFASLEWDNFISYIEVENLLPQNFLLENLFASENDYPGGKYLKINDKKKNKIWLSLFDLEPQDFKNFKPLFTSIINLFS